MCSAEDRRSHLIASFHQLDLQRFLRFCRGWSVPLEEEAGGIKSSCKGRNMKGDKERYNLLSTSERSSLLKS